jgi:photosystem II stability/assembly factor-like uncharacterized protein
MNTLHRLLETILLVILCIAPLNAQNVRWEHLAGPEGGSVRSIARTPDGTMFASLDAEGLYRSVDGGTSWMQVLSGTSPDWSAIIHVTSSGTLLLATPDTIPSGGSLLRSTDRGVTWSLVMEKFYWNTPLVNDSSGGVIGASLHELYRSTDDGLSWNQLGSTIDDKIGALVVGADGRLVEGVELNSAPRSVRISTDLGTTWSEPHLIDWNTTGVSALAATPDGDLFAEAAGGFFRSTDGGELWNWISFATEGQPYCNGLLVLQDGSIAVATYWGVYRSGDGGERWEEVGNLETHYPLCLALTPDGKILAGTYNSGIYAANGNRWNRSSIGLPTAGVVSAAIGPDRTIYSMAVNGRFFVSNDDGRNWLEPDSSRNISSLLAIDAQGTLYTASGRLGVIHSTDHGTTWARGDSGIADEYMRALLIGRRGDIYLAVDRPAYSYHMSKTDGLFHSTDRGNHWTTLGTGLRGITPQSIVELSDGTLFVGSSYDPRVMRLLPGDTLWQEMSAGLSESNTSPYAVYLYGLIADNAENLYAGTQCGLFRSSDRGDSWQRIGAEIADTAIIALALAPTGRIYASTVADGMYASDDQGASWQHLGAPLDVTGFTSLVVDSSGGLLAGNRTTGLYYMTSISSVPVTTVSIGAGLVAHPNPARSRTTIEFELPSIELARLVMYSSAGEQIGVIAEGEMKVGTNRIEFDLSRYIPGAYHLRLETRRGSEQIGVIIVR